MVTEDDKGGWKALVRSREDVEKSRQIPITPQTQSPAYKLAIDDKEFLYREELRPVRLQLELLKPEMLLQERGITLHRRHVRRSAHSRARQGGMGRAERGAEDATWKQTHAITTRRASSPGWCRNMPRARISAR